MNYEDEVATVIAKKLVIKTKKKIKEITCDDPCPCRENLLKTLHVLINMGRDVFNFRPEYYAAIIILAEAVHEMMTELEKTQSDNVIYL